MLPALKVVADITQPPKMLRPLVEHWLDSRTIDQARSLDAGIAPALTPSERETVLSEVQRLSACLRAREPQQLGILLAEVRALYGHADIGEAAYRLWMEALFGEDGYPPHAIRAAFLAHIKASRFFPTPAEIRQHAHAASSDDRVRLMKLQQALRLPVESGY